MAPRPTIAQLQAELADTRAALADRTAELRVTDRHLDEKHAPAAHWSNLAPEARALSACAEALDELRGNGAVVRTSGGTYSIGDPVERVLLHLAARHGIDLVRAPSPVTFGAYDEGPLLAGTNQVAARCECCGR